MSSRQILDEQPRWFVTSLGRYAVKLPGLCACQLKVVGGFMVCELCGTVFEFNRQFGRSSATLMENGSKRRRE